MLHLASSGEGALAMLPGMDGLTLLGEIKRRWPELTVMMVKAYGDQERRRVALDHGAADFIAKPVDFNSLNQQLEQIASAAA